MWKINKLGSWIPHDLNERHIENRKVGMRCLNATKGSHFCIEVWRVTINVFIMKTRSRKTITFTWQNRSFNTKAKSLRQELLYLIEPERYWELKSQTKPLLHNAFTKKWLITTHWSKNYRHGPWKYGNGFCYTTMLRLTQKKTVKDILELLGYRHLAVFLALYS